MNGDIQFDNINFAYPARPDVLVLRNLTLTARAGEITALVGLSGSGGYFAKKIQIAILFATSIYENIRFGKENATRIEIEEAARQADAHDFIMQLPNKYDTIVGENGVQLSGGEKQRVALARALVKQPALLLLDEATSALDNTSEKIVQEALDRACKGRTTIVIAHHLGTIQNAHRIYVLDNGCVIEQGTHETLMSKQGSRYREMMKAQQKIKIENDIDETTSLTQIEEDDQKQICTSGAICNRLSSDALAIQQMAGSRLGIVCESIATFGIGIVLGVLVSWQLTLIALFYIVSLFVIAFMQIRWQARLNKRSNCILELASSLAVEIIHNMRTVKQLASEAEFIVQEALERAQTDDPTRTSLIITHRLSTIRSCDWICVLDKGYLVESGTHADLMERRGAYYRMIVRSNTS
ncbi:unnamed protein product [Rotaria sp. Silwood1]|nr:unnamed protein product [Rotaria sp. Silwood1]